MRRITLIEYIVLISFITFAIGLLIGRDFGRRETISAVKIHLLSYANNTKTCSDIKMMLEMVDGISKQNMLKTEMGK